MIEHRPDVDTPAIPLPRRIPPTPHDHVITPEPAGRAANLSPSTRELHARRARELTTR